MEQTQTLAELLAPKLLERGIKVSIDPSFDSDAIFLTVSTDGNGHHALIVNPKYETCRSNDQFDFNELLKPDPGTRSMMDALKKHVGKDIKMHTPSQNYLNLRKSRY